MCQTFAKLVLILQTIFLTVLSPICLPADEDQTRTERIGIIVERAVEKDVSTCKFCNTVINSGRIHSDGPHIIENHVKNNLMLRGIIPAECENKVDKCVYVLLYRFEEKIGGDFSVERPASVGFHMHLLDRMIPIRSYTFDEEQKPLSSNLFRIGSFLKRRGKWIDATTLSEEGVKKGLEKIIGPAEQK